MNAVRAMMPRLGSQRRSYLNAVRAEMPRLESQGLGDNIENKLNLVIFVRME